MMDYKKSIMELLDKATSKQLQRIYYLLKGFLHKE